MKVFDYLIPPNTDQHTKKIFFAIFALGYFVSFSFWAQQGILPYLTRTLGVNPTTYGFLESSFALYQLVTSPIFGLLADRCGIKVWYLVSEAAAVFCYGSLSIVNSIPLLFLSRVPALFMHSLQSQYMVITHLTDGKDRADVIGKLGLFHGLGMISGTFFGGLVTKNFSPRISPLMSSMANIASILVILFFIPNDTKSIKLQRDQDRLTGFLLENNTTTSGDDTIQETSSDSKDLHHTEKLGECSHIDVGVDDNKRNSPEQRDKYDENLKDRCSTKVPQEEATHDKSRQNFEESSAERTNSSDPKDEIYCEKPIIQETVASSTRDCEPKPSGCTNLRRFWHVVCLPSMAIVIGLEVAVSFASSLIFSTFSMAVMDFYRLDASVNGILLSFIGVTVMFCQGFLVGFLTKRYKDSYLIKISLSLNIVGFLYLSVASKVYMLVLTIVPLLIGGTLAHIIFMVIITKIASDEDTGSALGIIFMLRGLMRAIAPSVGGLIFTHIGFPFIGVTGYFIELILLLIVMFILKDSQLDLG
ncbi:solute carrier family 22 member 18-like [Clytia hemisphaerica]|uniref:Major facilitator superfamily (MFS) profile domain-containing protein n=1 Tax=Clytia hemisphaerica TaxID=252671 RepID=A0A7M5UF13_9CNID